MQLSEFVIQLTILLKKCAKNDHNYFRICNMTIMLIYIIPLLKRNEKEYIILSV